MIFSNHLIWHYSRKITLTIFLSMARLLSSRSPGFIEVLRRQSRNTQSYIEDLQSKEHNFSTKHAWSSNMAFINLILHLASPTAFQYVLNTSCECLPSLIHCNNKIDVFQVSHSLECIRKLEVKYIILNHNIYILPSKHFNIASFAVRIACGLV